MAETSSVSVAADKLCKTQSTITKSIQRLEETIGGALFERSGNRLRLNDRGNLVLGTALEIVRNEQHLRQLSVRFKQDNLPTITVAYDAILPFQHVIDILTSGNTFQETHNINLTSRVFDGAYRLVESGDANVAVTAMLRESGNLEARHIGEFDIVNVVKSNADEDYWNSIPQCILGERGATDIESNLLSVSKHIRVESIEQKFQLIEAGSAWGRVPFNLAKNAIENKSLVIADAPGVYTKQTLPIYIVAGSSKLEEVTSFIGNISAKNQ